MSVTFAPSPRHAATPSREPRRETSRRSQHPSAPLFLQRKALAIDPATSPLEREADEVAERVMRMPEGGACSGPCAAGGDGDGGLRRKTEPGHGAAETAPSSPSPGPAAAAALTRTGSPLPQPARAFFEPRLGADLSHVRVHTDDAAQAAAREIRAHAFTHGRHIYFASGRYAPEASEGRKLLAHELAHTLQQADTGSPPLQRDDGAAVAPPDAERDEQVRTALEGLPGLVGFNVVDEMGGLIATERRLPKSFPIIRERIVGASSRATFEELYAHDAEIMEIVNNAAVIYGRLRDALDRFAEEEKWFAHGYLFELLPSYDLSYHDAAVRFAEYGEAFLLIYLMAVREPEEVADTIEQTALGFEEERRSQIEIGKAGEGQTIATRDVLFWFDDTIKLERLLDPQYGAETQQEGLVRARIAGVASAVVRRDGRYYVYALNEQYSFEDALAPGFKQRTDILRSGGGPYAVIVTTDGVVLRPQEQRYFVEEYGRHAEEMVAADIALLEQHGDRLSLYENFRLFRELVRDIVLANLAEARGKLRREQEKFFALGVPMMLTAEREAGEQLKADTAALRDHLLAVARLAEGAGADLDAATRVRMEAHLLAVGLIHARNPIATLFVINRRDPDEHEPVTEEDFEDLLAGKGWGDAVMAAGAEIGKRLANIDKVQQHLLENPDAVLDLTPLHELVLDRFTGVDRAYIELRLIGHELGELASAVGMLVTDLALLVTGIALGGVPGLIIGGIGTARGIGQTVEGFERAGLIEAMSELDITGEFALASPEMAASARRWAWIGLGLTLIDVGGFVHSATALARLRAVMRSPDVAAILTYNRVRLAEAAEALGTSEHALARQLGTARGAARARLLSRIRTATAARAGGGRYGFGGDWAESIPVHELQRLRQDLLARTDDVTAVQQAVERMGYRIDEELVRTIKKYNFDSPGLAFTKENYDAWMRLVEGRATVGDVRYIIHEAEEVTRLGRVRERTGFDFLGQNWERMTPAQRAKWHKRFITEKTFYGVEEDVTVLTGHYIAAHGHALEREFAFIAEQAYRVSGGRVRLSAVEAAAIDGTRSGAEARQFMHHDNLTLLLHPELPKWQRRAGELVPLSRELRDALGPAAIRRAVQEVSPLGSRRAVEVAAGAEPTLTEFLAILRRVPADF